MTTGESLHTRRTRKEESGGEVMLPCESHVCTAKRAFVPATASRSPEPLATQESYIRLSQYPWHDLADGPISFSFTSDGEQARWLFKFTVSDRTKSIPAALVAAAPL